MGQVDFEGSLTREQIRVYMKMFQVSFEERDQVLRPLAEGVKKPWVLWAMIRLAFYPPSAQCV